MKLEIGLIRKPATSVNTIFTEWMVENLNGNGKFLTANVSRYTVRVGGARGLQITKDSWTMNPALIPFISQKDESWRKKGIVWTNFESHDVKLHAEFEEMSRWIGKFIGKFGKEEHEMHIWLLITVRSLFHYLFLSLLRHLGQWKWLLSDKLSTVLVPNSHQATCRWSCHHTRLGSLQPNFTTFCSWFWPRKRKHSEQQHATKDAHIDVGSFALVTSVVHVVSKCSIRVLQCTVKCKEAHKQSFGPPHSVWATNLAQTNLQCCIHQELAHTTQPQLNSCSVQPGKTNWLPTGNCDFGNSAFLHMSWSLGEGKNLPRCAHCQCSWGVHTTSYTECHCSVAVATVHVVPLVWIGCHSKCSQVGQLALWGDDDNRNVMTWERRRRG